MPDIQNSIQDKLLSGEAFFADLKFDQAEACFNEVIKADPTNKEALNNLGVIAYQQEDTARAIDYFTRSLETDHFYKDAILNYATLLQDLNILHELTPILERAIEKFPNDEDLRYIIQCAQPVSKNKLKIAFLCLPGLESFLKDITDSLKTRYEVVTCYNGDKRAVESAIQQSDIVWLEWANELAIELTRHSEALMDKHVICRLHRYEAFTEMPQNIDWKKVNDLIFVALHIRESLKLQIPEIEQRVRTHIVHNGINLDRFRFKDREKGFNIAYIGYINHRKNPSLLLQCMKHLVDQDNRYMLHIAGEYQGLEYQQYFEQMVQEMDLSNNIVMNGWVEDIGGWLEDKQYIIHTSVQEGHPVGIMEAMARGLKPLIHHYVGARQSYPSKYLWNTISEFGNMVLATDYDSKEYREYIEKNFSLESQINRIEEILQPS